MKTVVDIPYLYEGETRSTKVLVTLARVDGRRELSFGGPATLRAGWNRRWATLATGPGSQTVQDMLAGRIDATIHIEELMPGSCSASGAARPFGDCSAPACRSASRASRRL